MPQILKYMIDILEETTHSEVQESSDSEREFKESRNDWSDSDSKLTVTFNLKKWCESDRFGTLHWT